MDCVIVDGSRGEGGGQVLRTSLALASLTGKRLRIEKIRAGRPNPGLARQHLCCVEAACAVSGGKAWGAEIGSQSLEFEPGRIQAGRFELEVGSAGSASLVIQTILPSLFLAKERCSVRVRGGTHNPWAPPFDFLAETFVPAIRPAGFCVDCRLQRYGFFPAGGGIVEVEVEPWRKTSSVGVELCNGQGAWRLEARIYTAKLPARIAHKQRRLLQTSGLAFSRIEHVDVEDSDGPGNCVMVQVHRGGRTSVFAGFGMKGKASEKVVGQVIEQVKDFVDSGAAVDRYLADQLLVYMAMDGKGVFTTNELSGHLLTNIETIGQFLDVRFELEQHGRVYQVRCKRA